MNNDLLNEINDTAIEHRDQDMANIGYISKAPFIDTGILLGDSEVENGTVSHDTVAARVGLDNTEEYVPETQFNILENHTVGEKEDLGSKLSLKRHNS